MSNAIFPTLLGMGWPTRTLLESTLRQVSQSGMEVRIANYPQARYKYDVPFGYLNDSYLIGASDFQTLMGFAEARSGSFDSFLFTDINDNDTSQYVPNPSASPTPSTIGIGDAVTTTFQLGRVRGGALHLLFAVNALNRAPRIYLNGTLQGSGYAISGTGLVTFSSAPGSGVTVAWDGQYYFRVRLDMDEIESENIAGPYHILKSLVLLETFQ